MIIKNEGAATPSTIQ